MNVPLIEMDPEAARLAFDDYRAHVGRGHGSAEDKAVMLGYQALASGKALVRLDDALRQAGLDAEGRPRLAVARADWRHVEFENHQWSAGGPAPAYCRWPWPRRGRPSAIRLPRGHFGDAVTKRNWRALVPIIPPSIRPGVTQLRHYRVLWEAEWQPAAPKDPMLLKQLTGPLHVVLAVWDLTELERAVLAGRLAEWRPR